MVLSFPSFLHTTSVIGPTGPPSPQTLTEILHYGRVDGALLTPSLIDQLCLIPEGLASLRELQSIHYAGAPLSIETGKKLSSYTQIVPCIGSTEAGGYFTKIAQNDGDWDYVAFQEHAGAQFEQRLDDLFELVFIRRPECAMQQVFRVYPDRKRFDTNDLFVEHPTRKGYWKIIGRTDDYVTFSHGDGLHASRLEPEIERAKEVKAALIGGHGFPSPILLVELLDEARNDLESENGRHALVENLHPYIDNVNAQCHACVQLSSKRIIFSSKNRPFIRTVKGSVARLQTLKLYEEEISAMFKGEAAS